jgi:hypothetical protein
MKEGLTHKNAIKVHKTSYEQTILESTKNDNLIF